MNAIIPPTGIRLPADLKKKIKEMATTNRRSVNAEIVVSLERIYSADYSKEKGEVTA